MRSRFFNRATSARARVAIGTARAHVETRVASSVLSSRRRTRLVSEADRRALFPLSPRVPPQHGLHLSSVARGRASEKRLRGTVGTLRLGAPKIDVRSRPGTFRIALARPDRFPTRPNTTSTPNLRRRRGRRLG
jgi:hypothetical protein